MALIALLIRFSCSCEAEAILLRRVNKMEVGEIMFPLTFAPIYL